MKSCRTVRSTTCSSLSLSHYSLFCPRGHSSHQPQNVIASHSLIPLFYADIECTVTLNLNLKLMWSTVFFSKHLKPTHVFRTANTCTSRSTGIFEMCKFYDANIHLSNPHASFEPVLWQNHSSTSFLLSWYQISTKWGTSCNKSMPMGVVALHLCILIPNTY